MRIGIDARPLKSKEYSGIPKVVCEVIRRWNESNHEDKFYLISNTDIELPFELSDNWEKIIVPAYTGNGTLWHIFRLGGIIKKLKLDSFWGTNYLLPLKVNNCRYLLTVHDLAFEIMPCVVSKKTFIILKALCRRSCDRADVIHTISESTKNDIINYYKIDSNKICVQYLGVDTLDNDIVQQASHKEIPNFKFILVLGTIEPRKNIETIIKAFNSFKEKDDNEIHIVFAGKMGWKYQNFIKLVRDSKYVDYIHIWQYVDDATKEMLLNNAEILLFPSLYEGFGLPVLEAFQHHLLVVTAENSSLPEVAGNGAIFVKNPLDYIELSEVLEEVFDIDTIEKEQYIKNGEHHLKKFSWEKCAQGILEMLKA